MAQLKTGSTVGGSTILVQSNVTTSSTDTTSGRLLKVGDGGLLSQTSYGKSYSFQTFPVNGSLPDSSSNMSVLLCPKGVAGTSIQGRFVFGRSMNVTSTYRNVIADVSYQVASDGSDGGRCLIFSNNGATFENAGGYSVVMTYVTVGGVEYVALTALNNRSANPLRTGTFSFSGISTVPFENGLDWVSGDSVSNITRVQSEATGLYLNGDAVYSYRNILGTVSQSGGAPRGAIIERGSNANGEYVRYADGTQISWIHNYDGGGISDIPIGSVFRTEDQSYTFPVDFSEVPTISIISRGNTTWSGNCSGVNSSGIGRYRQFSATANSGAVEVRIIAIGRWF